MTGPALQRLDSHHAIHETALGEAEELTDGLRTAWRQNDAVKAGSIAQWLVEHWEERILRHAEEEELGLYRDLAQDRPALAETVAQLRRDHDLMRRIWGEAKLMAETGGAGDDVLLRFETLLLIDAIHSRDEEERLLSSQV